MISKDTALTAMILWELIDGNDALEAITCRPKEGTVAARTQILEVAQYFDKAWLYAAGHENGHVPGTKNSEDSGCPQSQRTLPPITRFFDAPFDWEFCPMLLAELRNIEEMRESWPAITCAAMYKWTAREWARERWCLDDDSLIDEACTVTTDRRADPTVLVDNLAEKHGLEDPFARGGHKHGEPLPKRPSAVADVRRPGSSAPLRRAPRSARHRAGEAHGAVPERAPRARRRTRRRT